MLVPFIVGSISVILTYLSQYRQNGWGLKAAFLVQFVFLALRYDYGNDYMAYLDGYNEITSNIQIFLTEMRWEPGWNLLHIIFKPFGFFAMVAFTSLATCVVFYRFIRNFVPAPYQWLGMFLYVFDPYLFLVPASAMRQNIGILLFLIGIEFLYKKRIFIYLLLAAAAATFHKSGLVLIPMAALAFLNIKINKFIAALCFAVFVCLFWFGEQVFSVLNMIAGSFFPKYAETYEGGTSLHSGIGFIYSLFLLASILYFAGVEFIRAEGDEEAQKSVPFGEEAEYEELLPVQDELFPSVAARRLLFKLAILTFMFTPLGFQLAMIGRINMYFTPVMIAVYPIIAYTTRDRFFKLMFLGSLIPFTLFRFWAFFISPVWREKFGTYQTIFSAPQWY